MYWNIQTHYAKLKKYIFYLCYEVPERDLLTHYFFSDSKGMTTSLKFHLVTCLDYSYAVQCLTASLIHDCDNLCVTPPSFNEKSFHTVLLDFKIFIFKTNYKNIWNYQIFLDFFKLNNFQFIHFSLFWIFIE